MTHNGKVFRFTLTPRVMARRPFRGMLHGDVFNSTIYISVSLLHFLFGGKRDSFNLLSAR